MSIDVVLCAGLGVSTTIGEQVSGDVTFTCDGVLVNVVSNEFFETLCLKY